LEICGQGTISRNLAAARRVADHRCARHIEIIRTRISQANAAPVQIGEPPLVALFFARIELENGEILYCTQDCRHH